jgi:hypothetical protein
MDARARNTFSLRRAVLGTYIVNGDVARAEELLETAYLLIEGHEFEMAVVAAQVACELEVRAAIESRMSHLSEPLARLPGRRTGSSPFAIPRGSPVRRGIRRVATTNLLPAD